MSIPDRFWEAVEPRGPMLRPNEAAQFLGVANRTYYKMAQAGQVPAPCRIRPGGKATAVPQSWLEACVKIIAIGATA